MDAPSDKIAAAPERRGVCLFDADFASGVFACESRFEEGVSVSLFLSSSSSLDYNTCCIS